MRALFAHTPDVVSLTRMPPHPCPFRNLHGRPAWFPATLTALRPRCSPCLCQPQASPIPKGKPRWKAAWHLMGTSQFEIPRPRDSFLLNAAGGHIASTAMGPSAHLRGLGNQRDGAENVSKVCSPSGWGAWQEGVLVCRWELLPTNATGVAKEQQAGSLGSLNVHPAANARNKCKGVLGERVKRQLLMALWENASSDFSLVPVAQKLDGGI